MAAMLVLYMVGNRKYDSGVASYSLMHIPSFTKYMLIGSTQETVPNTNGDI